MFLKSSVKSKHSYQRGSMLVMALFVIIVMSLLGLAVIQILSTSNRSMVVEVYGSRALNTANSSAQFQLEKVFGPTKNCSNTVYSLPDISAFHGCEVEVTCETFEVHQGDYNFKHFRINSTATCTVGEVITEREISLEARERI